MDPGAYASRLASAALTPSLITRNVMTTLKAGLPAQYARLRDDCSQRVQKFGYSGSSPSTVRASSLDCTSRIRR